MGISFSHPLVLLLLPVIIYPVYLWYRDSSYLPRARRNLITALRVMLSLSLLLALAGLEIRFPLKNQTVVFVVDLSASSEKGREMAEDFIREALKHKNPDDKAGIVVFGREARLDRPALVVPEFGRIESLVDRNYSDIAGGLGLADAIMPQDSLKRVVLMSDGRQNSGDGIQEASRMADRGIRVDVLPLRLAGGPEVRIENLGVPQKLLAKERFQIKVEVHSNVSTSMLLRVYQDRALLAEERARITPGDNLFVYSAAIAEGGFHTFRAVAEVGQDTVPENNEAHAFTYVQGSPGVLLVEGRPGEGAAIRAALDSLGVKTEVVSPDQVPVTLTGLNRFGAVIVCNVPAEQLKRQSMEAIHAAVRDLGIGLIMVGGDQSFGPGGYFKTPVEKALPVHMDLRGKEETPSLGLVLVIDKSGSMSEGAGGYPKVDLAKEAAIQATQVLGPLDRIGVVAFDDTAQWVVKMRRVGNLEAIQDAIGTIRADGGTNIFPALTLAYDALKEIKTKYKHIILLTDGQSATTGDYYFLARRMEKAGITMSTVAVGNGADTALLQMLAEWGRGRYYFTNDSASIPRIFTKETMMALRSYLVEEPFIPRVAARTPLLEGIRGLPGLGGYVATSPKGAAQLVLTSHRGDPVLAQWQYGLGRSVAFTSDVKGRWAGDWIRWPSYNRLWGNIISWALPRNLDNALLLEATLQGGKGIIRVDSPDLITASLKTTATVVTPELKRQVVNLEPVAPGRYEGCFTAREPGTYIMNVTQWRNGEPVSAVNGGVALSYSPEYRYAGPDATFLKRLAKAGGGSLLTNPAQAFADNLPAARGRIELWPWLLVTATLLLPLDIGARRLTFTLAGILAWWRRGRMPGRESATSLTTARLRQRKHEVRESWRVKQKSGIPVSPNTPAGWLQESTRPLEPGEREKTRPQVPTQVDTHTSRLLEVKRRTRK